MKETITDEPYPPRSRFNRVVISAGHMIDRPERKEPRFPPEKEGVVREQIERQLARWGVGEGDLAVCGGARGADILFAELCADRRAEVWLYPALAEEEFLEESVRLPGSRWEERFHALRARGNVRTFFPAERSDVDTEQESAFARNNTRIIDAGLEQAGAPRKLLALLVWDEREAGEGQGGTSDFASEVRRLGARQAIINPIELRKGA